MAARRRLFFNDVRDEIPSIFRTIRIIIGSAILFTVPMYFYFNSLNDNNLKTDYREILRESITLSEERYEQLPTTAEYNLPESLVTELLALQVLLLIALPIIFFPIAILKYILRRKSIFLAAYASKLVQTIVFRIIQLRSKIFRDIRPYMFYTTVEIDSRSNLTMIRKALWITLVIFAASFQFAGLIYIRTNSFPNVLGFEFTLLDASVAFMIVSGSFWMGLVLGIDLLERFDIRILDLGRSKLMNIGKEFGKVSRNGFNFLTLSFVAIAVQDFRARDWVQVVVFLDIFFLVSLWILMTYETQMDNVGVFLRKGLDKRTISGAERYVINTEKKRFGEQKLKEAEEMMKTSDQRVQLAMRVGFIKGAFQSIVVTWFVLLLSVILTGLSLYIIGTPTLTQLLSVQLIASAIIIGGMITFEGYISDDELIRKELIWFPMFIVGNVIASYIFIEYDLEIIFSSLSTIIAFELLWFLFILRHIYPQIPGIEFYRNFKSLSFVLIIFFIMLSTVGYQYLLLSYFDFI